MKENRADIRFETSLTARWQGSPANQTMRISDLSTRGCYVDSIAEVTMGETLIIEILLTNGEWFELKGVVAHHTPRLGFGVRFVNQEAAQRRQIRSLLGLEICVIPTVDPPEASELFMPFAVDDLTSPIIM